MTLAPCKRCIQAFLDGHIRREAIQPLDPRPAANALAVMWESDDGDRYHCRDCDVAETMTRIDGLTWEQGRTAVGNRRQELYRLPDLPGDGAYFDRMLPSPFTNINDLYDWLNTVAPYEMGSPS